MEDFEINFVIHIPDILFLADAWTEVCAVPKYPERCPPKKIKGFQDAFNFREFPETSPETFILQVFVKPPEGLICLRFHFF